ncbi:MAG: 2-hydroxyacyl-CoA dehydratase [Chloroflexi bacterium]|nr:2-hydroxyacyl-CoA dehydratase [Chloroflexota bacterium]MBM3154366.1 2-hydroxyacyl-CoA dehydratase [Chloroflexota bacterium]MBM3173410.1 2-hydroxyacyl-CoA dehydratase [Chloroflexota bacterium]MBM3174583.1 2-hydroxyacyl-CoA dehydratase [Chloroflexota bacterium]MBM4449343.1 2-hydroxyacyl-CoA dehydratase [Chloroflexota bacterium]
MSPIDLSPFVDAVQERAERLRQYAEKQKVFGWFCTYTPIELIHAAGFLPVRIYGGATPIKLASTLVPDFVCPYMRTSLERALRGEYKYLSGIIQGYTCDTPCGIINIWEENAGPGLFHSVPLPYNTTESAISFYRQTLTELIQKLASYGGKTDADSLERSLDLYRDIRNCLLHLHQLRFQNRLALSAGEFYTVAEAGFSLPPDVYLKHLHNLISALGEENTRNIGIPVIVSGSLLEDTTVFDLIESAGGKVVADDLCNGYRFCYPADGVGADPTERLIDRYMHRFPCPSRSVIGDRVNHVKELIKQSGAAGAIFLFQRFCTPHLADYPALADELKKDGIPVLQVETDETVSNRGQLKTRFEAFFEMIGV